MEQMDEEIALLEDEVFVLEEKAKKGLQPSVRGKSCTSLLQKNIPQPRCRSAGYISKLQRDGKLTIVNQIDTSAYSSRPSSRSAISRPSSQISQHTSVSSNIYMDDSLVLL